ncbi:GNAT family N-acetyltransferase [Nonomuraea endophytica]|uniref:Ribosomal protein S18 acetylase RimI-like enzyme n=1 Tax=Nonomuraea endophytica TaxID=714136 RepID=A0A7W8EJD6_9ACTN|nr:GNAT family N-acetyltransferase [Nonomuraea endophytica]MBB5081416.1 ribosomal protein S18 acetylase RimI-like enzyme [Nonomuraea endophytica]
MIHELTSVAQVRAACGDDDLLMWAAQGLRPGARAWALGDAVVTAAPDLARRDRLAVSGSTANAVPLVRHALAELGPAYRPLAETRTLAEVSAKIDGMEVAGEFSWMSLHPEPSIPVPADALEVAWLPGEASPEVTELLTDFAPESYAVPGAVGVTRWAGLRVEGRLAAVAADAWSAPDVGLLAGVATAGPFRGRGLGERVCRWVSRELVNAYGRAALMVDDDNGAALGVYTRIGYTRRRIAAAGLTP